MEACTELCNHVTVTTNKLSTSNWCSNIYNWDVHIDWKKAGVDQLALDQEQPKHLLKEKILDEEGSISVSGFFWGSCLKNAFTAPVTPSSFSMALASSIAWSFTWKYKHELNQSICFWKKQAHFIWLISGKV